MAPATLRRLVDRLEKYYGTPPPPHPTDPFEQVLWINVAYLAGDADRAAAFKLLKRDVGLTPEAILHAPAAKLSAVTAFGILPEKFAAKLREAARVASELPDGGLRAVVALPLAQARRALRRFPGVGAPGADRILLFSGRQPLLAPDSNGLRVLQRVGAVPARKGYAATYNAATEITSAQLGADTLRMQRAHQLLRRHGMEICKTSAPACDRCPLASACPRIGV